MLRAFGPESGYISKENAFAAATDKRRGCEVEAAKVVTEMESLGG